MGDSILKDLLEHNLVSNNRDNNVSLLGMAYKENGKEKADCAREPKKRGIKYLNELRINYALTVGQEKISNLYAGKGLNLLKGK